MVLAINSCLETGISHVFSLFRPLVHLFSRIFRYNQYDRYAFLKSKKWSVGGIENAGNSCFISVVLQEFANFPEVYDQLFSKNFEGNKNILQQSLLKIINNIRSGSPTRATHITHLRALLKKNGWQEPSFSRIKRILHRIFPRLFPLPTGGPFELYEKILHLFNMSSDSIVLIDDNPTNLKEKLYSVDKRFQEISISKEMKERSLYRIWLPLNHQYAFSDIIETKTHRFTLRQIHYSPKKDHIATARKIGSHWLHINDNLVIPGKRPEENQAVLLIYECEKLSSALDLPKAISSKKSIKMVDIVSQLMNRQRDYQLFDKKLEAVNQALEKGYDLKEDQKLTLREFRAVEELGKANVAFVSMRELITPGNTMLKCASLAYEVLRKIDQLTKKAPKGNLITYSITEAEDYGGWKIPGFLKWISRKIYRSEVVHMGVVVPSVIGYFISDLTTEHRWKKFNIGDYIYERYFINWKNLVQNEQLTITLGENWEEKLQKLFEEELFEIHKDRKAFSSAKNTLFHVLKRNFLPRSLWASRDKNISFQGEMLCSTFAERLLSKTLLIVEKKLKERFNLNESKIFDIPLAPYSTHNDLPHQMMNVWSNVLLKIPPSKTLSRIIQTQRSR